MQRRKSPRHVRAANARWRRAEAERDEGIPDMPLASDIRQPFTLQLSHFG